MSRSFVADGNIPPSRFVKIAGASADGRVLVCGSGDRPFGVAQEFTHNPPITIGGQSLDDGYAGTSGVDVLVYTTTDEVKVEAGAAFSRGDFLKPDSVGRAVTAGSDGDFYGAVALAAATAAGQLIPARVELGSRGA